MNRKTMINIYLLTDRMASPPSPKKSTARAGKANRQLGIQ